MTESLQNELIAALPPTLAVIVAFIGLMRGQKQMHLQMNSRLDELLKARVAEASLSGAERERSEERERQSNNPAAKQEHVQEIINKITEHDEWERENAALAARATGEAAAV